MCPGVRVLSVCSSEVLTEQAFPTSLFLYLSVISLNAQTRQHQHKDRSEKHQNEICKYFFGKQILFLQARFPYCLLLDRFSPDDSHLNITNQLDSKPQIPTGGYPLFRGRDFGCKAMINYAKGCQ